MRAILMIPLIVGLAACGSFVTEHSVETVGVDPIIKARDIEIISEEQAEQMVFIDNVEGHTCRNQSFEKPAERQGAIDQARIAAVLLGADAIVLHSCEDGGFSLIKNCWSSWECHASAYRRK